MWNIYIRESLYNTLFRRRLPLALTSFWTGRFAKKNILVVRTHTVNPILKSAHFLGTLPRASWHDTCRATVCRVPYSLVVGEDCLYTSTCICISIRFAASEYLTFYWDIRVVQKKNSSVLEHALNRTVPGVVVKHADQVIGLRQSRTKFIFFLKEAFGWAEGTHTSKSTRARRFCFF
jgi:hypothetical protein